MLKYGIEPDGKELAAIEKAYRAGDLLSGEIKDILIKKITVFLEEHHKKREKAKKAVQKYLKSQGYV